jgi:hypothetical protein
MMAVASTITVTDIMIHSCSGSLVKIPSSSLAEMSGAASWRFLAEPYHLADWWPNPAQPAPFDTNTTSSPLLFGNNAPEQHERRIQLYKFRWKNPRPGVPIASIDFESLGGFSPFLLAITAEASN